ncbi:MAG TPA: helix-turn-helix domain-containing protein [Conexibacter sp.]|nr:helix-turn-helix domain-containing protein [Conexibacter sp.]
MPATRTRGGEREALFVRIPTTEARALDRAAFELKLSKQELVSNLVSRYVDPASPASMEALRTLGAAPPPTGTLSLGRHDFRPDPVAEVLDIDDAAALLQVEPAVVERLAEEGELPGRRLGDQWRFARQAILAWLSADSS